MTVERERRTYFSLANVLTILAMVGGVAGVYATNAADNAKQKERVDNLKERIEEVRKDSKDTNAKVDLIIRKLDSWEATQRERDRAARERERRQ